MKSKNRVTILNMLSTLILAGISIFTAPLFSRLLGTEGYGILSTYTVWMNAMTIIACLNTCATLVHARVRFPEEEQERYQSSVMTLSLTMLVICSVLILLFAGPVSSLLKMSYTLMAWLVVQSFGAFCMNFLSTKLQYELKAGWNMLSSLVIVGLSLSISLVLVFSMPQEQRYIGRILGNVIAYGLLGTAACVFVLYRGRTFFRWEYWKFCLRLVFPLIFMDLSYLILGHTDQVMVREYLGDSPAGIYGLAYTFGGVIFTIFTALNKSWVPFFIDSMKEGDRERTTSQAKNFMELYTVLSMGFVLLSREVFHIFADRSFWDGTMLIPLFAVGYYFNFLCTFPVNYEQYHLNVKMVSAVTIVSSLINVLLNNMLIRRLGLPGAVCATMISQLFQFAVHQVYVSLFLGKGDYPFGMGVLWKHMFAFAAAVLICLLLPDGWLVRWPAGAVIGIWELLRIRKRRVLI